MPFAGADGDGDGMIDSDDYGVWKSHFGETLVFNAGSGGSAEALNEPVAPALAAPSFKTAAARSTISARAVAAAERDEALLAWLAALSGDVRSGESVVNSHSGEAEADVADSDPVADALDAAFAAIEL